MRVITISRLLGAYGDIIASIVARRMNLTLVGRDQLHEMAQTCDPEFSDLCAMYETEHGPGLFERFFFDRPSYTSIFEALTFEVASRGNVVLVGRGAQIILREVPGIARIRVVAPKPVRIRRVMERFGFAEDEAEHYTSKYDHDRENLVRSIFLSDPQDWSLYDLIVNTEHLTAGAAAELVVDAVEKMEQVSDREEVKEQLLNMAMAKRMEALIRKKLTPAVARSVQIRVEPGGVVKLSGRIPDQTDKLTAEELATGYPGVSKVESDLRVTQFPLPY